MRIIPIQADGSPQLDPDLIWSGLAGDLAVTGSDDPVNPSGFVAMHALRTAVLICLMTDGRVDATELRDGDSNRGWPGDAFDMEPGDVPLGSKLWLLRREALRPGLEIRAEDYVREALQTLIDQGAFVRFDVSVTIDRPGNRLDLSIAGYGRDGSARHQDRFSLLWDQV